MDDSILKGRRRFLEGVGVGGGLLLAGCTERLDLGSGDDQAHAGDHGESVDGVAAIASIDREALQEAQMELQRELQNGNITQEEAQEELAATQERYLDEAMNDLTGTIEETEGVSVDEEYRSLGAATVSGDAAAILSVLDSEDVSAFVSKSEVESRAQTGSSQGTQQADGTQEAQ